VTALARQALAAEATKEVIGETLRVACILTGIGSLYVASEASKPLFP
jgi:alkylhydroperoxidase/carboxymuconolactone decarboxylase family protein YurZ